MKLYLVRHAQSKRNAKIKSEMDADLSQIGEEQARRLGSYFQGIKLDKIYCSTLKRAKKTFLGIKPFLKRVPVSYSKDVIEHKMGIFSSEGKDDWKGYAKAAKKEGISFVSFKPKYGESLIETYLRAGNFYKKLRRNHKRDKVLVVGHGIFLLYLILNILGLDISEGEYYKLNNASVSTLEINVEGKVKKFHINDYNHLIKEAMKK